MKKVIRRQSSIIQKALSAARTLRNQFPQKQEVVSNYLMEILTLTFEQVDDTISFLIKSRKIKQSQVDPIRQLLLCSQQWKQIILDLKNFPCIWQRLRTQNQNFKVEYKTQMEVVQSLIKNFLITRRVIVQLMIDVYNKSTIENLPLRLQEDQWKTISIPNRYYNILGEIIYGNSFSKHVESVQRKLLSSSLLLERNTSIYAAVGEESKRQITAQIPQNVMQFDLQMGQNIVTIFGQSFKMTSSSLAVIDFIHGYLEWASQAGEGQLLQNTVLSKVSEFIFMYNQNIKKLILGKQALKYGKIKGKTITAKYLVIAFSQLKFIKILTSAISKRFESFIEFQQIIINKVQKNMGQISKKFRQVLNLGINESINRIVVNSHKPISAPVQQSKQIVVAITRSSDLVKDILLNTKQMDQFIGINWCDIYISKINEQYKSVYKSIMNSNGTRKSKDIDWSDNIYWKFKELQYMVTNLEQLQKYLPNFTGLLTQLQLERKKLEKPQ